MTKEMSNRLEGVRKGVVLPIITHGNPIAVLGITGEPAAVGPYALLVQKVAELFIQETIRQMDQEKQARDLEFFVFDWLHHRGDLQTLMERSEFFQIQMDLYSQVVMFRAGDNVLGLSYQDVKALRRMWDQKGDALFVRWGQGRLLLLIKDISKCRLEQKLKKFMTDVIQMLHVHICAGVGQAVTGGDLRNSYQQAERACEIASEKKPLVFEEDLRLEMIIQELRKTTREKFVKRTIAPLSKEAYLLETLQHWFENDMSTSKAATRMHVHKNTLHYRLKRVEELTGLRLNRAEDLVLLYLGFVLLQGKR
ncbi:helix-turn-helix domain-containing protein [Virgibacillus halophilus]|uniref:Helix-turn-helix domain-containing protein n=2 Tax=Tigheibacillus halophilus TaxID=361280 RepID=A0ABU5C737_9BACI|nr:helix-turn-helix domain-containing protein [Virgibacillus halophilus]